MSSFLSPSDVGRLMVARGVDIARECSERPESWPRHLIVPCEEYTRDRHRRAMAVRARHEERLAEGRRLRAQEEEERRRMIDAQEREKRRRTHAELLPAKLQAFTEAFQTRRAQRAVMSVTNARRHRLQELARRQEYKRQSYESADTAARRAFAVFRRYGDTSSLRGVRERSLVTVRALEMMFARGGRPDLQYLIDDLQTNTNPLFIAAAAMDMPAMLFDDIITWESDMERQRNRMEGPLERASSVAELPTYVIHALHTDDGKLVARDLLRYRLKGQLRPWMAKTPLILNAVDERTAAKLAALL